MTKRYDDVRSGAINLMLNISGYNDEALIKLIPLLVESGVRIPGLRLTFYNSDAKYRLSSELKRMLEKYVKYKLFTPAHSDGVKALTAEVRRQHVILTEDNMMVFAARAASVRTVILPDAGLQQSGRSQSSKGTVPEGEILINRSCFFAG